MPQISYKDLEQDPVLILHDALEQLSNAASAVFSPNDPKLQAVLIVAWEALMHRDVISHIHRST